MSLFFYVGFAFSFICGVCLYVFYVCVLVGCLCARCVICRCLCMLVYVRVSCWFVMYGA